LHHLTTSIDYIDLSVLLLILKRLVLARSGSFLRRLILFPLLGIASSYIGTDIVSSLHEDSEGYIILELSDKLSHSYYNCFRASVTYLNNSVTSSEINCNFRNFIKALSTSRLTFLLRLRSIISALIASISFMRSISSELLSISNRITFGLTRACE